MVQYENYRSRITVSVKGCGQTNFQHANSDSIVSICRLPPFKFLATSLPWRPSDFEVFMFVLWYPLCSCPPYGYWAVFAHTHLRCSTVVACVRALLFLIELNSFSDGQIGLRIREWKLVLSHVPVPRKKGTLSLTNLLFLRILDKWRCSKSGKILLNMSRISKSSRRISNRACYIFEIGDLTMFKKRLTWIISRTEITVITVAWRLKLKDY